ncbi:MAG: hypothetical protein NZ823_02230 [Blastocatellia bacterium]|nr:hypothetical protein [Blastocatellia bacterium]
MVQTHKPHQAQLDVASGIERVFFDWGRLTFTPFPIPLRPYPRRIQDRLILFDVETTADTVVLDAPLVEPRISNIQWSVPDVDVTNGPQQATLWVSVQIPNRPEAQELDVIVKAERDTDPSRTTLNTQAPRVLHSLPTRINPGQTRTIGLTVAGINLSTGVEGLLAYDVTFSLDFGNHFLTCPTDSNFPRSFPGDVLVIRRSAQKTARIRSTTFNPTTTNPGGSSALTVTVETENVTSQDFLQVYVELSLPSVGCGLLTAVAPGESNPQGKLGSSSGLIEFRFTIIVPAGCSVPTGTATWKADLVNLPSNITKLRPVQDSAVLSIQPGQLASYIKPRVVSLAVGQSKPLTPEDQHCQPMQQFPQGTTFVTRTLATPPADGGSIATVSTTGLITARSRGVVNVDVTLPGTQYPLNCSIQGCRPEDKPLIQVGPMTIYLRFPSDTIQYMMGRFPRQGLGLSATEVEQVKEKARRHLAQLFEEVGANVTVTTDQPRGFREGAPDDGVVTIDVVAKKNADGTFERTRTWNDPPSGPTEQGRAPVNELNWIDGGFGIDAVGPEDGVFINRLGLINDRGHRATLDEIGYGIANIAAHEVGHTLGMVPNATSDDLRTQKKDERFANISFDGDGNYHAGQENENIMQTNTSRVGQQPRYLTNTMHFRTGASKDEGYLQTVLPRP